jgi:hypothetical protein
MSKMTAALGPLALISGLAGCGSSAMSTGGGGNDNDTGGNGTTGMGGGTSTATGSTGIGVAAGYECGSTAAGSCDQIICGLNDAYTQSRTNASCTGAGTAICDAFSTCIESFRTCFQPLCPAGTASPSPEALTCATNYSTCATSALSASTP